ncbi:2789_t:CDS:2 [Dentiscutata erythropus]|uniref:2789_t:CDS:1 n=1 Tax=Dentiscutata erythropus TaxID=1348616 RepID=A0A9N9CQQ5_9GLOM|nr:2789_t:CDS:2 [Dentiscutata erythropus]
MTAIPDRGYKYIFHIRDYFTHFSYAELAQSKSAEEAATSFLNFCFMYDSPVILHTNNRGEFIGSTFKDILSFWLTIKGLVEKGNDILQVKLGACMEETENSNNNYDDEESEPDISNSSDLERYNSDDSNLNSLEYFTYNDDDYDNYNHDNYDNNYYDLNNYDYNNYNHDNYDNDNYDLDNYDHDNYINDNYNQNNYDYNYDNYDHNNQEIIEISDTESNECFTY